jgi:hypothetical protein
VSHSFDYDESHWPIVRVLPPTSLFDDATFERHLGRLEAYLQRRQPLVFIVVLQHGSSLTLQQRERFRRYEAEHRDVMAQFQRGVAIVVHSAFQRAMVNALFWLTRSPNPARTFASAELAMSWANGLLGQADTPPSAAQRGQVAGRSDSMRRAA